MTKAITMKRRVEDVLKDNRYDNKCVTIRVEDFTETFQPDERKQLMLFWGKYEVSSFYMINTSELIIYIV